MTRARLRAWCVLLRGWFALARWERDLSMEVEHHLESHIDDNVRAGMTPEDARRHARQRLGGIEVVKESVRERHGVLALERLLTDIRFAFRLLWKDRSFTLTAILT